MLKFNAFLSCLLSRMGPFQTGFVYESTVANRLASISYEGSPIQIVGQAGAGHGPDVKILCGDKSCGFESKTQGAFEGGQSRFKLVEGVLRLPDSIHKRLAPGYIPFEGRIPPFFERTITKEDWLQVKHHFQDEYKTMDSLDLIGNYYKEKGSAYIQIENYGLYRTGEDDPLNLEVPIIRCKTMLRTRCKQHKSTPLTMSVTCALIYDKKSLEKSPFCLMTPGKLPLRLSVT